MRIQTVLFIILAASVVGCSKQSAAVWKPIVPATAAAIAGSSDFKLEHTTKSGIQCYVRPVTREEYRVIPTDSRDHRYLAGSEERGFLVIPIRNGSIIELNSRESIEVAGFMTRMLAEGHKRDGR